MSKDDINVFELQVSQTLKSTFDDVLPGKSTGVVSLTSVGTKEDLGGDDVVSSILIVSLVYKRERPDSPIQTP